MFYSCNSGNNWNQYSDNLPGTPFINDLEYDANQDKIVAATYGTGVYLGDLVEDPCELSSSDNITSTSINLYPNPLQNVMNVELPKTVKKAEYTIYKTSGVAVKSGEIMGSSGTISTSELTSGNYILKITSRHNIYNQTFTKI
jgi:hypothetical protein